MFWISNDGPHGGKVSQEHTNIVSVAIVENEAGSRNFGGALKQTGRLRSPAQAADESVRTVQYPGTEITVVPVEPAQFVEADLGVGDAEDKVQKISGDHGDQVQFELEAFHVALT